jgi:hypothetical protein
MCEEALKKAVDRAILRMSVIVFTGFKFPTWEEFKMYGQGWSKIIGVTDFGMYLEDGLVIVPFIRANNLYINKTVYNAPSFPVTPQGYTDACNWLNEQKRLIAEQFCG